MEITSSASGWAFPFFQALRQKNRHRLGQKSRAGKETQNSLPFRGRVAGLFQQFAFGGHQLIFARLLAPRGKLPQRVLRGMAVLPLKQDLGLGPAVDQPPEITTEPL